MYEGPVILLHPADGRVFHDVAVCLDFFEEPSCQERPYAFQFRSFPAESVGQLRDSARFQRPWGSETTRLRTTTERLLKRLLL